MSIIIAKNTNVLDIILEDLGIVIPGSSILNLTDTYELYEIIASDDLKTQVFNQTIIINDGTTDLSKEDGLNHISQETVYEYSPDMNVRESIEESITYSQSWVEKVKVTANLDSGSYFLNWTCDIKSNTNDISNFCETRIRINDSNNICVNVWPYAKYQTFNGSDGAKLSGLFSAQIDFRRQGPYQPVYIKNAKFLLTKI